MSKSDISKEEFIRVGTTLYKLVNQPRLNGGYVKKRIVWNNETLPIFHVLKCVFLIFRDFQFSCIFGKRIRLQRTVSGMEKVMFENVRIYVTDMNITPFTVGLLKPKIVLPKVMADSYSKDELKSVIQHEQTHIRLGHLWFGFAWDMLRCLLWINPLLTVFQKHFRADMEDICDRVCIQSSRRTAHEYGMVLLKTLKLLSSAVWSVVMS